MNLYDCGAYFRAPGGNVENVSDQQPVISWAAWSINADNGANGDPSAWTRSRLLWDSVGIAHFPWLHCHSINDIERLIAVAVQQGSPAIGLNIENVVNDGLDLEQVAVVVNSEWVTPFGGKVHMATEPWVQNGQGWEHLAFAVAALEIFPDENDVSKHVQDCIDHAFAEGLVKVTLMYKAKLPPATFDLRTCHSLYAGDDIAPTAEAWRMWIGPDPCLSPMPSGGIPVDEPWYLKPYPKGVAVGPGKLPRTYYPPSHDKGTFIGPGVLAMKRAISRAQRWQPWAPEVWDKTYGEKFAMGRGTGRVGDSGVRGFQRQEGLYEDGVLGDETYQRMRRCKVPAGKPNAGEHIFDAECQRLLQQEVTQFGPAAIAEAKFQKLLAAMKLMDAGTPGYLLGGGHGIPLSDVSPYQRLDCSSSTSKALHEAGMYGMGQYAIVSGDFVNWGLPGVGKYFTVYCNSGHVWTRLHKSQWWRFDTSPQGDGGRGPKLRYLPRFTGGFAARHWPEM